jgi:hypothetical protein
MKKGIMFSIILFFLAITLVGLIAIQRSLISYRREMIHIEMRVKSLNNMYDSLIRDAGSTIDTSLRRAMYAAFNNVSTEGVGLSEANETLKNLVLHGTLDGGVEDMMENATLPYWIGKIAQVGVLKGFYIDITLYNDTLEIRPYDSFNLLAEVKMDVNITDIQGVAALNRSTLLKKIVSVEEQEDPLYPLNTNGFTTNTIVMSPYIRNYTQVILIGSGGNNFTYGNTTTDILDKTDKILIVDDANSVDFSGSIGVISQQGIVVPITIPYIVNSSALSLLSGNINVLLDGDNGKVWYIENFKEHVDNSYYHPSETGASYLDRLEGKRYIQNKYSSQTNYDIGLESFINKRKIPQEIPVDVGKTNIDYLYFSSGSLDGDKIKGVSTPYNSFRIDVNHQQNYSVQSITE